MYTPLPNTVIMQVTDEYVNNITIKTVISKSVISVIHVIKYNHFYIIKS